MNAAPRPGAGAALSMTMLLLVGLLLSLSWAAWFEIDQTVRAQGQLIPSSRTQIIQAVDGGVLAKILVHEGQAVEAGQFLALLEKARPKAALDESRVKDAALAATLVRAQAETAGQEPVFGPRFKEFPEIVAAQLALYAQRKRSRNEELAALTDALATSQEELRMNETLLQTGDTSRLEVMRAQRQVGELRGKINAVNNKYLQDARQEASKLAEELAASRYKLQERQSVLGHTEITSPVAGIVKYLRVTTIGGVLRSGDELMQISPTDGGMVIEIKVNPADIGQLKLGLPATVKLDAFDYSVYGTLVGTLSYISSDTLTEQGAIGQTVSYYRGQVRLDPGATRPGSKLANVALKPGMTATVDLRTDGRTVLQYLAKPLFKAVGGAMNER